MTFKISVNDAIMTRVGDNASTPEPTPEMIERRIKWVAALRSGRYDQEHNRLRSRDGSARCCLGVATLASVCGIRLRLDREGENVGYLVPEPKDGRYSGDLETALLPLPVAEQLGFTARDIGVTYQGQRRWLSVLNDEGVPFTEIADLIEDQYIKPFQKEKSSE